MSAIDYERTVTRVIEAAQLRVALSVTALAVHGVVTGQRDLQHRRRLNHLDIVTPDGQAVRWALNALHGTKLTDRVYGPRLMLLICQEAAKRALPVFLYGSRPEVVGSLAAALRRRFPDLIIAGAMPSVFRCTTREEKRGIVQAICDTGARIVFVGLGCPRQEVFTYEYHDALNMPLIAVGAAFDYHSGRLKEPPEWVQRYGLQWLFRLGQDPRRLWRRYLSLNICFIVLFLLQRLGIYEPAADLQAGPKEELRYG